MVVTATLEKAYERLYSDTVDEDIRVTRGRENETPWINKTCQRSQRQRSTAPSQYTATSCEHSASFIINVTKMAERSLFIYMCSGWAFATQALFKLPFIMFLPFITSHEGIAPLIFKYDPYHSSLVLGKSIMNKHVGKHTHCIIKSRRVLLPSNSRAYRWMSGDPRWGLFNDLTFSYEPSVKI